MKIILLGAPGAGKGTQADVISNFLKVPTISTGACLREAVKAETKLGLLAKEAMDLGHLVADDIVGSILSQRLENTDCKDGYILDGYPRTILQAKTLEKMGIVIDKVIDIEVKDEDIEKRLTGRRVCEGCGATYHTVYKPSKNDGICDKCNSNLITRKDDMPQTVRERLQIYHGQTQPLIEYYKEQNKLYTVVGQEEISDTTALTLKVLAL